MTHATWSVHTRHVTYHCGPQRILRGLTGGRREHRASTSQHCHVIRHSQGVAQFVGDQDDGAAAVGEPAHPTEQFCRLRWCEYSGRFVKNQQFDVTRQRLHNFTPLLRADTQRRYLRRRIELQSRPFGHITHPLGGGARVESSSTTQRHVLRDRHCGYQREMLMDHADSRSECGGR